MDLDTRVEAIYLKAFLSVSGFSSVTFYQIRLICTRRNLNLSFRFELTRDARTNISLQHDY